MIYHRIKVFRLLNFDDFWAVGQHGMVKQLLVIVATILAFSSIISAKSLTISVQSTAIQPYEEVVRGFNSVCIGRNKPFVLSALTSESLAKKIENTAPDLVLTVGLDALDAVKSIQHLPIIYSMVLCSDAFALSQNNITGVCMQVPAEIQLQRMLAVLPKIKHIGILFDPTESEKIVTAALGLSQPFGVKFFATAVQTPHHISTALEKMRGHVDVIWMLPDLTLKFPQSMELFALFSFENAVPLVTYSDKYLELGAFMSIGLDAFDMGRQAGEMANRILSGSDIPDIPPMEARTPVVTINKTIAEKLGVEFAETISGMDNVKIWKR